jgi:hypothetical protein
LFAAVAMAFNATCLVNGDCSIWAWITVIIPILAAVYHIYSTVTSSKDE